MKEELYLWIRNLAVFYIFFTAVLNLIPDQKYEKYVRFFLLLQLIFFLCSLYYLVWCPLLCLKGRYAWRP